MSGLMMLFLVVSLGTIVYIQMDIRNKWSDRALVGLFPVLFISTMGLEGFRTYLMPLYASSWLTYGLYMGLLGLRSKGRFKITRKAVWFLSLLILLPAILQTVIFPVGETPRLNGQYPTGTKTFLLPFSDESSDKKKASPQVLRGRMVYPAGGFGLKRAPWFENGKHLKGIISKTTGIPWIYLSNLDLIKSQSMYDVPPAPEIKRFPVVILMSPWGGYGDSVLPVAESLASRGYVVLIAESSLGSAAMYVDGKVHESPSALDYDMAEEQLDQTKILLDRVNAGEGMERMKDRLILDHIIFIGYGPVGRVLMQPGSVHMDIAAQVLVEPVTQKDMRLGAIAFKHQTSILSSGIGRDIAVKQGMKAILKTTFGKVEWKYIAGTDANDFEMLQLANPMIMVTRKGIDGLTENWSKSIIRVISDEVDESMRKTGVNRPRLEDEESQGYLMDLLK